MGIPGIDAAPLVSIDFKHDPCSSIDDATLTRVMEGNMVKVSSGYDNLWGRSNAMPDTTPRGQTKASAALAAVCTMAVAMLPPRHSSRALGQGAVRGLAAPATPIYSNPSANSGGSPGRLANH